MFLENFSNFMDDVCFFLSDITDTFKDFIEDVTPKIAEIAVKLGPAVNAICVATTVAAKVLFPELNITGFVMIIGEIAELVTKIAELFGDKHPELDALDLAMRSEKCEEKPENFDSYNEYIDYLANNIEADKEKMENLSDEDRMAYLLSGMAIREKQISQNVGAEVSPKLFVDGYKAELSAEELGEFIDICVEKSLNNMDLGDYFKGNKLEQKEQTEMRSYLHDSIQKVNPDMNESEIQERIYDMKEIYNSGGEK